MEGARHPPRARPRVGGMINTTYEQADIEYIIRELSKRCKGSESLMTTWERTATVRPHVALDAVYAALKGAKGSIGAWPPDVGMALDRLRTAIAEVERER